MLIFEKPTNTEWQATVSNTPTSACSRPKSSRLRHKINDTYAYFSKKVDPLIAACVANFLFRQPVDVFNAMKFYFLHIKKGLGDNCLSKIECRDKKIAQKIYFTENLCPVLAKIVDLITTSQPPDLVDFVCVELTTNLKLDESCGNNQTKVEAFMRHLSLKSGRTQTSMIDNDTDSESQSLPTEDAATKIVDRLRRQKQKQVEPTTQNIQICMLGNGGGGKTSILNGLQGNFDLKPKPSLGFKPTAMKLADNVNINFFDLGGNKKIRSIWSEYYHDVHAVLYVFDSTLRGEELDESVALFQTTMTSPFLANKPLLIIANKQGSDGALTAAQLSAYLDLRACSDSGYVIAECFSFTTKQNPTHYPSTCSAESSTIDIPPLESADYIVDRRLETALESFLGIIQDHFTTLDTRVRADVLTRKNAEMQKRLERERKVLKNRIAAAFREKIELKLLPENLPDPGPGDFFTKEEGKAPYILLFYNVTIPSCSIESILLFLFD